MICAGVYVSGCDRLMEKSALTIFAGLPDQLQALTQTTASDQYPGYRRLLSEVPEMAALNPYTDHGAVADSIREAFATCALANGDLALATLS